MLFVSVGIQAIVFLHGRHCEKVGQEVCSVRVLPPVVTKRLAKSMPKHAPDKPAGTERPERCAWEPQTIATGLHSCRLANCHVNQSTVSRANS